MQKQFSHHEERKQQKPDEKEKKLSETEMRENACVPTLDPSVEEELVIHYTKDGEPIKLDFKDALTQMYAQVRKV